MGRLTASLWMQRLGILCSHPIQYVSPLLREVARRCDLHVYYGHRQTPEQQGAAGFRVAIEWDVDLLSGYQHTFLQNVARRPGVASFLACDTPGIAAEIRRHRFDAFVVMGWNLRAYWQAIRACRCAGVPVLVRGDSQLRTPRSPIKRLVKEATHRWMLRQLDGHLYVGQRSRDYLLHYGADPARMFFVPHVVDGACFRPAAAGVQRCSVRRRELGIQDGANIVLFVGRLLAFKRPMDILRACADPILRRSNCHVVFVGSGPLDPALREEAALLGVRASFAGFCNQSELASFYHFAEALVLPSDGRETWGLVVNEAMACGTPTIVSDAVGCMPDLIDEDATGAVFGVGDVHGLASAIHAVLGRKRDPVVQAALADRMAAYSVDIASAGILAAADCVRTA